MPILAAEPSVYPATLLDELPVASSDRRWWAVYSRARQEKALARQLLALEVPFYLPLVPKTSLVAGRRVKSLLPLFNSYLFAYVSDEERILTLGTKRVAHLFEAHDNDATTRDLRQVRSLIAAGVPMTIEGRLEKGRRVRVKSGSLQGLEGVVVARRGEDRLVVAVEFLQQGVSVLISDFQVEPL